MAAFTWRGIQFREAGLWISPVSAMNPSAEKITAQYLVNWTDMDNAKIALLGTTTRQAMGTTAYLSRQVPHAYPSKPYLFASEVTKCEPEGTVLGVPDVNRIATFTDARLTVQYTRLPYDIYTDESSTYTSTDGSTVPGDSISGTPNRYIIRKAPVTLEKQLTYEAGTWMFTETGRRLRSPSARSWCITRLQWVWMGVPLTALDRLFISNSAGNLNNATFDGLPAGTLLLRAPVYETTGLPDGQRAMNVTIIADFNPVNGGWNSAIDRDRQNGFYPIGLLAAVDPNSGLGTPGSGVVAVPYPQVINFDELFQPK